MPMSLLREKIVVSLDALTDEDIAAAARGALEASGLTPGTQAEAVPIVEANLRWGIGALRTAPTADLVKGAPYGGRGLRQEVWDEFDEDREGIERGLRLLILREEGEDFDTCSMDTYSEASDACHEIMEAAADHLFGPLAEAIVGISKLN
ncbi:MAG: hypothetical protein WA476_21230 [Acidobacteriaceae bacterium]